jgi:TrmH family RNA methyltransferase
VSSAERFRTARRDPGVVLLEGLHAIKHALRFGADLLEIVADDVEAVGALASSLAPDVADELRRRARQVDWVEGVAAIARRPVVDVAAALSRPGPVVLLEDPRNLGNLGACVRVAAACDIAAVLTTGRSDPWLPDAIRGAAGLQFALPVARVEALPESERPLIAIDPSGDEIVPARLPPHAVLAFGTERHGLSDDLLTRADSCLRIPMRPGVSSLNLATSVAAVLYARRLTER